MFEKLREIRVAKGIPGETLAEVIGLETKSAYYKKENGSVKFSINEARAISKFFGMSIEDIFFPDEVAKTEINK